MNINTDTTAPTTPTAFDFAALLKAKPGEIHLYHGGSGDLWVATDSLVSLADRKLRKLPATEITPGLKLEASPHGNANVGAFAGYARSRCGQTFHVRADGSAWSDTRYRFKTAPGDSPTTPRRRGIGYFGACLRSGQRINLYKWKGIDQYIIGRAEFLGHNTAVELIEEGVELQKHQHKIDGWKQFAGVVYCKGAPGIVHVFGNGQGSSDERATSEPLDSLPPGPPKVTIQIDAGSSTFTRGTPKAHVFRSGWSLRTAEIRCADGTTHEGVVIICDQDSGEHYGSFVWIGDEIVGDNDPKFAERLGKTRDQIYPYRYRYHGHGSIRDHHIGDDGWSL